MMRMVSVRDWSKGSVTAFSTQSMTRLVATPGSDARVGDLLGHGALAALFVGLLSGVAADANAHRAVADLIEHHQVARRVGTIAQHLDDSVRYRVLALQLGPGRQFGV